MGNLSCSVGRTSLGPIYLICVYCRLDPDGVLQSNEDLMPGLYCFKIASDGNVVENIDSSIVNKQLKQSPISKEIFKFELKRYYYATAN